MTKKVLEMCLLFDFYGEMLTDKQKDVIDYYYNEDLSLSEIAEHLGISRQGVRDSIVRGEEALRELEDKLGFVARFGGLDRKLERISELSDELLTLNAQRYASQELEDKLNEIFTLSIGMRE